MTNNKILMVKSVPVTVISQSDTDFISLTDMVRQSENGSAVIDNWLRNKNTLEFLSVWEEIYNPAFNSLEFEGIKKDAGFNRFTMSVIRQGMAQVDRLKALNATAIHQMRSLLASPAAKKLGSTP